METEGVPSPHSDVNIELEGKEEIEEQDITNNDVLLRRMHEFNACTLFLDDDGPVDTLANVQSKVHKTKTTVPWVTLCLFLFLIASIAGCVYGATRPQTCTQTTYTVCDSEACRSSNCCQQTSESCNYSGGRTLMVFCGIAGALSLLCCMCASLKAFDSEKQFGFRGRPALRFNVTKQCIERIAFDVHYGYNTRANTKKEKERNLHEAQITITAQNILCTFDQVQQFGHGRHIVNAQRNRRVDYYLAFKYMGSNGPVLWTGRALRLWQYREQTKELKKVVANCAALQHATFASKPLFDKETETDHLSLDTLLK